MIESPLDRRERRSPGALGALLPLFVFSGATSLVYQALWVRQLHLVVGTSQVAVATVLAAFMTGLAMGGFLGGRLADGARRPVLTYAVLEAGIGLYALLFPWLLDLVQPLYLEFWRANEPTPTAFALFQFGLLGLLLLPPTICMGATLPLLARFATSPESQDPDEDSQDVGARVGHLYGANTLGAVLGTALAGFVFLPQFGLSTTTALTAAGNVLLCVIAVAVALRLGEIAPAPTARVKGGRSFMVLALVAFLGGTSGLIYEVAWFRVLALNLGGSAYAFTIMLLAFLIGIAGGGWFGGGLADRVAARFGGRGLLRGLALIEGGIAVLAWCTMYLYGELPYAFTWLYDAVDPHLHLLWPAKLLLALLLLLPPTVLMGAAFPFLVRAAAEGGRSLGGPVGALYGWNTVGGVVGAAAGSLLLLPSLHVTGTVILAIGVNLAAASVAILAADWSRARASARARAQAIAWTAVAAAIAGLAAWKPPPWEPLLMTAGMYKYASELSDRTRQGVYDFAVAPYDLLFYEEGLSSVVTVARSKANGNIWLANNGKVDASSSVDMPTQVLCAQLPFAFRPQARDVAVIGLASGVTAGTVTLHPGLRSIEVIELEPAILRASSYFDDVNHRPLADPRTRLYANDGRNHIILAQDGSYDVVISEPSNPWLSGVSNLFTQEFFELGKRKLRPGGVWSQWVQMYGMGGEDLRSLLRTFAEVYPYVRLFSTIEDADLVLVGSEAPLSIDEQDLARLFGLSPAIRAELSAIGIDEAADLLIRYQADRERILAYAGEVEANTDDNMRIEYSAPLHLHEDTADANFLALLGPKDMRRPPMEAVHGLDGLLRLAHAYARGERWVEALIVLKEAWKQGESEEVEALYNEWQGRLVQSLEEEQ